jgi:hypothetical protein
LQSSGIDFFIGSDWQTIWIDMTKNEANRLLDEVRDGNRLHPIVRITEALWETGDCVRNIPVHTQPFSEASINEWMESTRMVQGEGIGTTPIRDIQGNQSGIDSNNER